MKRQYLIFILVISIITILFTWTFALKVIINGNIQEAKIQSEIVNYEILNKKLKHNLILAYTFEGLKIDFTSTFLDEKNTNCHKNFFLNRQPKLYVYVHSPNCQSCIDKMIFELMKIKDFVRMEDLVFFGQFKNTKEINILKNTYPFIENVFSVKNTSFDNPFKEITVPVMFIMDESMRISCVYIADKGISSSVTIPYFQTIGKRFFDWDEKLYETKAHQCSNPKCTDQH